MSFCTKDKIKAIQNKTRLGLEKGDELAVFDFDKHLIITVKVIKKEHSLNEGEPQWYVGTVLEPYSYLYRDDYRFQSLHVLYLSLQTRKDFIASFVKEIVNTPKIQELISLKQKNTYGFQGDLDLGEILKRTKSDSPFCYDKKEEYEIESLRQDFDQFLTDLSIFSKRQKSGEFSSALKHLLDINNSLIRNRKNCGPFFEDQKSLHIGSKLLEFTDTFTLFHDTCNMCGGICDTNYVVCACCCVATHMQCCDYKGRLKMIESYENREDWKWTCVQCTICEICDQDEPAGYLIICDYCGRGYHYNTCLEPPLLSVPSGNWYCNSCESLGTVNSEEKLNSLSLAQVDIELYGKFGMEDTRTCAICGFKGDNDGISGLLIYAHQNTWVHTTCAYWSGLVSHDVEHNILFNVGGGAIRLSESIRCCYCNKLGASLYCDFSEIDYHHNTRKWCKNMYHVKCAIENKCLFLNNRSTCCHEHNRRKTLEMLAEKKNNSDMEIRNKRLPEVVPHNQLKPNFRLIVDFTPNNLIDIHQWECYFRKGNITILNFGYVNKQTSNHSFQNRKGFACFKVYWSLVTKGERYPYFFYYDGSFFQIIGCNVHIKRASLLDVWDIFFSKIYNFYNSKTFAKKRSSLDDAVKFFGLDIVQGQNQSSPLNLDSDTRNKWGSFLGEICRSYRKKKMPLAGPVWEEIAANCGKDIINRSASRITMLSDSSSDSSPTITATNSPVKLNSVDNIVFVQSNTHTNSTKTIDQDSESDIDYTKNINNDNNNNNNNNSNDNDIISANSTSTSGYTENEIALPLLLKRGSNSESEIINHSKRLKGIGHHSVVKVFDSYCQRHLLGLKISMKPFNVFYFVSCSCSFPYSHAGYYVSSDIEKCDFSVSEDVYQERVSFAENLQKTIYLQKEILEKAIELRKSQETIVEDHMKFTIPENVRENYPKD